MNEEARSDQRELCNLTGQRRSLTGTTVADRDLVGWV